MNSALARGLGIIITVAAILGIIFSLVGIIGIWRFEKTASVSSVENLDLVLAGLETTAEGLVVADEALQRAEQNVLVLTETISTTARTLNNSAPLLDTFIFMVDKDFPETVTAAQTSLASAQEGARVIDNVLGTLNRIPLIGNIYNPPDVPLHQALGEVSTSLDSLPETFATMEASLEVTRSNLDVIQADVEEVALQVSTINTSLQDAREVIRQYQAQTDTYQTQLQNLREALPAWINLLAWVFTLIFLWLGISQIGLIIHGFELLKYPPHNHADIVEM